MTSISSISLTIDGRAVTAVAGQTILDVARANGIEIPTLCHDPRLPPYGSCLICVVEVQGVGKLVLSCATEVRAGMVVQTRSERIFKARKSSLDLLLSNHFADCRGNCYEKCPAHVDVQGYLALANAGKYYEALELIRENNPLPLVCGRVCVRYCEANCRREHIDSAVGVNYIKRYVADLEHDHLPKPVVPPANGHRIAVVGGGPAGLTAAYYLAREGFDVTIFEMHPKLGGMIRWGIPDYRLPEAVVDKEIAYLLAHGIKVKLNTKFGREFSLDDLQGQGYGAIFLAMGAQVAKSMGIANENVDGVIGGITFLERVKKNTAGKMTGHVLVVGGGNTAVDCARTALRCKADLVSIVYRRTREEMPADEIEIEDAIAEGIDMKYLTAPLEVVAEGGRVKALRCQRMELGEPDASGRRKPVAVKGSEFDIPCSAIIGAIGQDSDLTGLAGNKAGDVKTTKWKTIVADDGSFATSVPGVFAGGDIVSGPAAVIDAIGIGHRAAKVMAHFVRTGETIRIPLEFLSKKETLGEIPQEFFKTFAQVGRAKMQQETAESRVGGFHEVDLGIAAEAAKVETSRCMSCGCTSVFDCDLKKIAEQYNVEQGKFHGKARKYDADARHPFIALDANKCILCGKCVRLCGELIGSAALGFVNRGFETMVKPSLDKPLQETTCISCGNCIDICPTGAIDNHFPFEKPGPWLTTEHESVCGFCGVGCRLVFNKKDEDLWFVTAKGPNPHHDGELCLRGRFGHAFLRDPQRVVSASIRQGQDGRKVAIDEAVEKAVAGLTDVVKKHGPASVAVLVSPKVTNEEAFLLSRIAREGFHTSNLGSLAQLNAAPDHLETALGLDASTVTRAQVEQADVIVVLNSEPVEENPVLSFGIHRALRRGATVVSISSSETRLSRIAALHVATKPGSTGVLLHAVASTMVRLGQVGADALGRIDGGSAGKLFDLAAPAAKEATGVEPALIEKLAKLLGAPQAKVVVICHRDSLLDRSAGLADAATNLLLLAGKIGTAGSGLLLSRSHCNAQGLVDLGISPEGVWAGGPAGLAGAGSSAELVGWLQQGKCKGLLIVGEDPAALKTYSQLLRGAEFVAVLDTLITKTTASAHVLLPLSPLAETSGSVTSMDRTVRVFAPALAGRAERTGWEILALMAAKLGMAAPGSLTSVRQAIAAANPRYAPLAGLEPNDSFVWGDPQPGTETLFVQGFAHADRKARFSTVSAKPLVAPKAVACPTAIDRAFEEKIQLQVAKS